jgi:shikimate dehydrogenase
MERLFVVGARPAKHSLTPLVWNAIFRKLKMKAQYEAVSAPTSEELHRVLYQARAEKEVVGLNITMPWKEEVARHVDSLYGTAKAIGAVNTVKCTEGGELHGYNTDGWGAVHALMAAGAKLRGETVVVAGAGGAAKSIVFELASAGALVKLHNRTVSRAIELAGEVNGALGTAVEAAGLDDIDGNLGDATVFLNTTSLGALGEMREASILSANQVHISRPDCFFMDVVYRPRQTALLTLAASAGRPVVFGSEMLVMQAVKGFEHFFDRKLPEECIPTMQRALETALRRRDRQVESA